MSDLLARIEDYYDRAPRPTSRAEDIGPFTLFVAAGPFPYYARPLRSDASALAFGAEQVHAVRRRQRELGVVESFEWTHELAPELTGAMIAAGMTVEERPLLALDQPIAATPPVGVSLRFLAPDEPRLAPAVAAVDLGFIDGTTEVGSVGGTERDVLATTLPEVRIDYLRELLRDDLIRWVTAEDGSGPVGGGSYHPRNVKGSTIAEITGIATIPAMRGRGIGASVVAALVGDARRRGADTIFLSAGSAEASRVYERVGFRRIGTACAAQPAPIP